MFYKIVFDYSSSQSGNYSNPNFNNLQLPSMFNNDKKRFCKVHLDSAFINCEISGSDESNIYLTVENIKPLNQIKTLTSGFSSSGLLGILHFFKSGASSENTYKYQHQDNNNYLLFDKNDFNTNFFEFKILDSNDNQVEIPSSADFRNYRFIMAIETTDDI